MNPDTNQFEPVIKNDLGELLREDGGPVPKDWPVFKIGEVLTIRRYRWRVERMEGSKLVLIGEGQKKPRPSLRAKKNQAKRRRKKR